MGKDLESQVNSDITKCVYFCLQFDESTDMADTAQLCIFIRMVFSDMSCRDLLTMLPLKEKTRREDIYNVFINFVKQYEIPIYKLMCITTDGAPSMTGVNNGFVALCRANDDFPSFFSFHCIIHQQVLCSKILNMDDIMKMTTKIVNSKAQLEASDSVEHTDLLLHTDVRWLSRGKFLDRFQELLSEIISFLEKRGDDTHLLQNEK
ncbi:protein FAM200A-like [Diabrotica virgifera virgifera]|uniref:Protein FAM200A-like n=1 Tax=Diabrotica virgifera virgifera TaxID=50390 RepID=A0A6P7H701_DIAVI|nr:protein FAM200A-like [Diabrotica virgifera virgifera]